MKPGHVNSGRELVLLSIGIAGALAGVTCAVIAAIQGEPQPMWFAVAAGGISVTALLWIRR